MFVHLVKKQGLDLALSFVYVVLGHSLPASFADLVSLPVDQVCPRHS